MMTPAQRRILVIRGGAIGDFILTLPAIRLIRENITGAYIEVLGYPGITELALTAGIADAVRSLEHRTLAPLFARNAAVDEEVGDYLRSFNLIISYLYDPDGFFKASLERAGVKTFIEVSHRVQAGEGPAAVQLARPLEKLAMFLEDPAPVILPSSAKKEQLAIHPGSGSLTKNWPLQNWIELGRKISETQPQIRVSVITGEAEHERGTTATLREAWKDFDFQHIEGRSLSALAQHLAECTSFIGHDSGISHLAAACGAHCLLLFGPTDPATWAPQNPRVEIIRAPGEDLSLLPFDHAWQKVADFLKSKNA
jgi:ADP-heptose:LPS heptosyltransferase